MLPTDICISTTKLQPTIDQMTISIFKTCVGNKNTTVHTLVIRQESNGGTKTGLSLYSCQAENCERSAIQRHISIEIFKSNPKQQLTFQQVHKPAQQVSNDKTCNLPFCFLFSCGCSLWFVAYKTDYGNTCIHTLGIMPSYHIGQRSEMLHLGCQLI